MQTDKAIFAAGCFWAVQDYFDQVPGVTATLVGYTGGHTEKPGYEQVCSQQTGHAESIYITFDPTKVSYYTLVKHFFRMHDPTQVNRQGPDVGSSYRSAIFYVNDEQQKIAKNVVEELKGSFDKPIATEITEAGEFYVAEDYHQNYAKKNGQGTCHVPYEAIA